MVIDELNVEVCQEKLTQALVHYETYATLPPGLSQEDAFDRRLKAVPMSWQDQFVDVRSREARKSASLA